MSDQHYYPGRTSTSHRASIALANRLGPWALISNGDAIDAACISRWPVGSFSELVDRPLLKDEVVETAARLGEYGGIPNIRFRVWNLGNHDKRFEARLADRAAEFEGLDGFTLKDHFPGWIPAMRTDFIAPDGSIEAIVKHRHKGGVHAGRNNALLSGTTEITGHDHMLKATPVSQANRVIWGIHAGTMAPIDSPAFVHYTEDNVVDWHEGFVVLHFKDGKFLGPELVYVIRGTDQVFFRGELLTV
jgi:hypothetical protein